MATISIECDSMRAVALKIPRAQINWKTSGRRPINGCLHRCDWTAQRARLSVLAVYKAIAIVAENGKQNSETQLIRWLLIFFINLTFGWNILFVPGFHVVLQCVAWVPRLYVRRFFFCLAQYHSWLESKVWCYGQAIQLERMSYIWISVVKQFISWCVIYLFMILERLSGFPWLIWFKSDWNKTLNYSLHKYM